MDFHSTTHSRSSTFLAFGALALAFAALAGGCDQETGIIIEVDKGALQEAPDTLRFLIGVEDDAIDLRYNPCANTDGTDRYVRAPASASDEANVGDRDLANDPYRLFLRPDSNLATGSSLVIVVEAVKDGVVIGGGALDKSVGFVPDNTVKWKISLIPRAGNGSSEEVDLCRCASEYAGPNVVLTPSDDADCDTYVRDLDCDDNNPWIYPNAPEDCGNFVDDNCDGVVDEAGEEICDGVDNNCDGFCDEGFDEDGDTYSVCGSRVFGDTCGGWVEESQIDCRDDLPEIHPDVTELCDGIDNNCIPGDEPPPMQNCYTYDSDGICVVGQQFCDNTAGGGFSECEVFPDAEEFWNASPRSCEEAEQACVDEVDIFTCSNRKVYNLKSTCYVAVIDSPLGPNTCPDAYATMPDMGVPGENCTWTVLGAAQDIPYDIVLVPQFGDPGYVVNDCRPDMWITEVFGNPQDGDQAYLWMSRFDEPQVHLRVEMVAVPIGECPFDGTPTLDCTPPEQVGM